MRNRIQYILASGFLCVALCALNFAPLSDAEFLTSVDFIASQALAQDADAFGEDSEDDPFAADEDDPFAVTSLTESSADAEDEVDQDAESPFSNAPRIDTPFAPSSLPSKSTSKSEPTVSAQELSPEEKARAEERAKYRRAEDIPDDLKTESDFYETASAAELSALRVEPTNNAEWFRAATRVSRIGRPAFAKLLVAKALDAPVASPEESAKILDSLGAGRAIYFVGNPEIGAVGGEVYELILKSARQYWESEQALRLAFERASSGSVSERSHGVVDARKGGASAIKLLISDLVVGTDDQRRVATDLLPFFKEDAVSALIACVRSATNEQLPYFVNALAEFSDVRIGLELATRYCLGVEGDAAAALVAALDKQYKDAPRAEEIAKLALDVALGYYRGQTVIPRVVDGYAEVWNWNAQDEALTCVDTPVPTIRRAEAARWALAAYFVGRDVDALPERALDLAIATVAERDAYGDGNSLDFARQGVSGFNSELPDLDTNELVSGLKYALETGRYAAALIPTILLQERGDESLCYDANGPSTIVQAATCPDRRVRYEALVAIASWNPTKPYPGSSRIVANLEWFASASGERVVVVTDPHLATAGHIGQAFASQGFRVVPATTGRDALLAAQSSPDVEFVYATSSVSSPNIGILAQTLRSDARTSDVPLLIGAGAERDASAANVLAGREPNVLILPPPRDSVAASWAIQKLNDTTKVALVPAETRLSQASSSARLLLQLLTTRPSIYELNDVNDLTRRLLSKSALFEVGIEYASTIKTPYAQKTLVELAGDTRYGIDVRNSAVDAFEKQLKENGLLLRGPDVVAMYARYNASESEDVQTQQVLSRLLDVYEARTKK